jgi:hypothetical protein
LEHFDRERLADPRGKRQRLTQYYEPYLDGIHPWHPTREKLADAFRQSVRLTNFVQPREFFLERI